METWNEPVTWWQLIALTYIMLFFGITAFYIGKWYHKRKFKRDEENKKQNNQTLDKIVK